MNKKITAIGGGTGLSTLLRGLKNYDFIDISAVVTMMDDGGSSGRLKKEFNTLPFGDLRNCLVALSKREDILAEIFNYRFPVTNKNPEVGGHSLGNLLMFAVSDIYGGFDKAIKKISDILYIKGKVLPITLQRTELVAIHKNGTKSIGETKISHSKIPIEKIIFNNKKVKHYPEVVEEIFSSDLIVIGPGSLFTSILPNLIIKEVVDAISKTKALKVYIANIMTQPGETDNYKVSDHIIKIYQHCNYKFIFDFVLINSSKFKRNILKKYEKQNSFPVQIDDDNVLYKLSKNVIKDSFIDLDKSIKFVRHNPEKLAKVLLKILNI